MKNRRWLKPTAVFNLSAIRCYELLDFKKGRLIENSYT